MNNNANPPGENPYTVALPAIATVRECAVLKQQLLVLLESAQAVQVDVTNVELIDAAALQLLFAFDRERLAGGLSTIWQGDNLTFQAAVVAMGLPIGDCAGSRAPSGCKH